MKISKSILHLLEYKRYINAKEGDLTMLKTPTNLPLHTHTHNKYIYIQQNKTSIFDVNRGKRKKIPKSLDDY